MIRAFRTCSPIFCLTTEVLSTYVLFFCVFFNVSLIVNGLYENVYLHLLASSVPETFTVFTLSRIRHLSRVSTCIRSSSFVRCSRFVIPRRILPLYARSFLLFISSRNNELSVRTCWFRVFNVYVRVLFVKLEYIRRIERVTITVIVIILSLTLTLLHCIIPTFYRYLVI